MKKLINIFLVFMILLNTFFPFIPVKAAAKYDLYMSYYDGDVFLETFEDYEAAVKKMQETPSNEFGVAVIKNGDIVINANYAFVKTNKWQIDHNDYEDNLNLFQDPSLGYSNNTAYTYVNGGWGVDSAFIDFNTTYNMVKLKISGFTGWARLSSVEITPLSKYFVPKLATALAVGANVRSEPSATSSLVTTIFPGTFYVFSPSKTTNDGEYDWYYLTSTNFSGWVREDLVSIHYANGIGTYYYAYNTGTGSNMVKEIYHRYDTKIYGTNSYANIVIGKAPEEMTTVSNSTLFKYYSFDGNYFYTDVIDMLEDYKLGTYENSINPNNPYFSYYMYLPSHSKSGYNAETFDMIISNAGYTSQPDENKVYAANCAWQTSASERTGLSKLYGTGEYFIEMQNTYGVNSLMAFGKAMSESGSGTSLIAMQKNNLFGIGASDKNPCTNATSYENPRASIMAYGSLGTSYTNPWNTVYRGSHYGNKGSGMNVKYASDPYWGEKAASHAYSYDNLYGKLDYDYNTIGVKESDEVVPILKTPGEASSSNVIYYTKNYTNAGYKIPNIPFIVLDKVYYNDEYYYKVQTDPALDNNQNVTSSNYTFENSYGYIKEEYLTVNNNQPTLEATNKTIKQGEETNLLLNVTATDIEDGKLTDITYDDSRVNYFVPGDYDLIYSVKDSSNFNKSITVKLTVEKADNPIITGENTTTIKLKEFDMLKDLTIYNNENLDKVNYIIKKNNVEVTYNEMIENVGIYNVIYTALDKFGNSSNTFERVVEVIENDLPVIEANDIVVTQNSSVDLSKFATATDKEDGNLTDKITYTTTLEIENPGSYSVTYNVSDLDGQSTTKTVTITVEEMLYTSTDGYLHLDSIKFNEETNKLDIKGFLNVNGIKIDSTTNIKYDLVLLNEYNKSSTIISLDRLIDKVPFEALNGNKSWFNGNIDLSSVSKGNYKIYVRARVNDKETKKILTNVFFLNDITSRFGINSRGYTLRSDYSSREMPLELTVRDNGLITNYKTSILYNMYNQYYKIEFAGPNLKLRGTSHSYNGDYSINSNIEREVIFENINTFERYIFDLGYITNGDYKVSLAVPDGYDKTKAWYDKTIDISSLDVGTYSIIIRTKTDKIDDYGELYDYMWSNINFVTTYTKDEKTYNAKIVRNNDVRMRLELIIEEA